MRTVREWVEFLKNEPKATFAIEDIHGLEARLYFSAEKFYENLEGFGRWLDSVPVKVYYNNNHRGGTLFIVDILGK